MDALFETALVVVLAIALCAFAYNRRLMTLPATIASAIAACVIGICGNLWWEIAMILFPAFSFVATKSHLDEKEALGVQEGVKGCRALPNILGVILFPTMISVIFCLTDSADLELTIAFLSALAVSTADTLSSELGVRDPKVYMITTGKPCERGMNGGVSRYGLLVSTIGCGIFAFLGYVIIFQEIGLIFLVPWIAGVFGNVIDSVEGAVFENRGLMSKYTVNMSSSLIGAIAGFLLSMAF